MTNIESKKVQVNSTKKEVYDYLRDMNNFIDLLPQDKVSDWKSDTDSCQFKVAGGYKIGLQYVDSEGHDKMIFKSTDVAPFPFTLNVFLNEKDNGIEAHQVCEAEINPFLKMMVEKPLKNLFDYIADRLSKKYA